MNYQKSTNNISATKAFSRYYIGENVKMHKHGNVGKSVEECFLRSLNDGSMYLELQVFFFMFFIFRM